MSRRSIPAALVAGVVFLLALVLRVLFWRPTPDAAWPSSAAYQGDAFTWLAYAQALLDGAAFEGGLPWRPPGMAWLIAWLGGGREGDVAALKLVWCVLGALVALVVYRAVRRDFGDTVARIVGILCAASTGLIILSTSLNNETPWLLLAMLGVAWVEPLRRRPTAWLAGAWGAVNAAACLIRAEHLVFFVLALAWIVVGRLRAESSRAAGIRALPPLAAAPLLFLAVLAPWHLRAWSRVAEHNDTPPTQSRVEEARYAALEAGLAPMRWDPQAEAAIERVPIFARRTARIFVAATVARRGGDRVEEADLEVLEEAFGARPSALPEHFFVALYGGLNFYLANNADAVPGFTRGPLDRPPPLAGGASRYPAMLVAGLPPPDLALVYPPHNEAVAHGYRLGWRWIARHPVQALARAGAKLRGFWSGVALGWTGYNLPTGLSGLRRSVDLVVPQGLWGAAVWPLLMLLAAAAGLAVGWRHLALVPWLLFFASRAAMAVAFFGYARVGATVIPVVSLLLALAAVEVTARVRARRAGAGEGAARGAWRRPLAVAGLVAAVLVTVETARWASRPELSLDGRPIGATDPFPDVYRDLPFEVGTPSAR